MNTQCFLKKSKSFLIYFQQIKFNSVKKIETSADLNKNAPPPQNSPAHILNVLNDDCIKEIFRCMKDVNEIANVANVCLCFRDNMKVIRPKIVKNLRICDSKLPNHLSFDHLPKFLGVFADVVQSIDLVVSSSFYLDINILSEHCAETLKKLRIVANYNVNVDTYLPFRALEEFELLSSVFYGLNLMSPLKSLKFNDVSMFGSDWLAREFPELKEIELKSIYGLSNNVLIEHLQRNPQLQGLKLCNCVINQAIVDSIYRTPNLKHLTIDTRLNYQEMNLMVISQLRQLKSLRLYCRQTSVRALFESMAKNGVALEEVWADGVKSDFIEVLVRQFKLIKQLVVHDISDGMLEQILQNLPKLESFAVFSSKITLGGILRALQNSRNSQTISIGKVTFKLDLDGYHSILALAQERGLTVELNAKGECLIPDDVLQKNMKWISIGS